jgi:C2 domain
MEIKSLEVTMISAKDLKKVNFLSKMSVYAIATISGADPADIRRTVPDKAGGRCPNWGTVVRFVIRSLDPHLALRIVLRSEGFLRDREVGEVSIPVHDLLESGASGEEKLVSYQVCRPSGRPKGVLNLSYKVIQPSGSPSIPVTTVPAQEKPVQNHVKGAEPVTAFPAVAPYPPPSGLYQGGVPYGAPPGYHPYPPAYPYPIAAPAYGYSAPQPHTGYGYGPIQAPKKSRFGAGLGMGILGGALGGMMLGDLMTDNLVYDAGFDDGSAF